MFLVGWQESVTACGWRVRRGGTKTSVTVMHVITRQHAEPWALVIMQLREDTQEPTR